MGNLPLRWAAGDRAMWRGLAVVVHYVAEDGALIEHERTVQHATVAGRTTPITFTRPRFMIVALADLSLRLPH